MQVKTRNAKSTNNDLDKFHNQLESVLVGIVEHLFY